VGEMYGCTSFYLVGCQTHLAVENTMSLFEKLAQMNPESIDQLGYGNITHADVERLTEDHPDVFVDPQELTRIPPPGNSDEKTRNELRYITNEMVEASPADLMYMEMVDKDILAPYNNFLSAVGEEVDWSRLEKTLDQVGVLTMWLKNHFQRPRPFQLAHIHKIALHPHASASPHSPSYPSGHSTAGYVAGNLLGRQFPDYINELENIAKSIAHTRIVGGWHFPSDNEYAQLLSLEIVEFIKYP